MVEGDLRLAVLSELGQRSHAQREVFGLDVEIDTVLVSESLIKCEMSWLIPVFVEPEGAHVSFGQRLRD
ncbi:hypothetical protein A5704_08475 [Mycobacterium sp. E735]|nr:hypothetical protein A5704_08475 [Mycobacterium sp. E735]